MKLTKINNTHEKTNGKQNKKRHLEMLRSFMDLPGKGVHKKKKRKEKRVYIYNPMETEFAQSSALALGSARHKYA